MDSIKALNIINIIRSRQVDNSTITILLEELRDHYPSVNFIQLLYYQTPSLTPEQIVQRALEIDAQSKSS